MVHNFVVHKFVYHSFEQQIQGLTSYQLNFIRALCRGVHTDFGSKAVLEEYNLGTKSNISRIKTALLERELIDVSLYSEMKHHV